jgi:hypothetical protein
MAIIGIAEHVRRGVAAAVAVVIAGVCLSTSTEAGIDTGGAVGIGLGSFALGAASRPYYGPYYYPYGYYYPPAAYYPPPPPAYYPPPRNCWDPYYGRYFPC